MSRMFVVIFVTFNYIQHHPAIVNGLKCYECMSESASSPCIFQPKSVSECDRKYCTIYRQELVDPAGHLINFYRACQDHPRYLNTVIKTATYKIYYQSCTTCLCNDGNGTDNNMKSNNNAHNVGSSLININIVPRIKSPGLQLLTNSILLLIIITII